MAINRIARYLRYVAEILVVFLGVFLGLLAENYRELRRERADERVSLSRLILDLEADRQEMLGNLERTVEGHSAALWLLERADVQGVDADSLGHYLERLQRTSILSTNTSEYSALKGAGRINIIQDADLRQGLTEFYESYPYVATLHSRDSQNLRDGMNWVAPYLRPGVGTSSARVRVIGRPAAILSEPRFLYYVSIVASHRNLLMNKYSELLDEINRLQARAQAYLESTGPGVGY